MTDQKETQALDRLRLEARFFADLATARILSFKGSTRPDAPVILNSLPKSGTHLAIKLLENMSGAHHVRFQLSSLTADLFPVRADEDAADLGVASPRPASLALLRRRLRRIPPGAFITAHVPYSEGFATLLGELGFRMVLLLRDPRDVAVSSAAYLASGRDHVLTEFFESMAPAERIQATIAGVDTGRVQLRDLRTRVESTMAWQREPLTTTIRFEDLVGPRGGGDAESQLSAVAAVARHVGIPLDGREAKELSENLYGGTSTFRRGQIGGWRDVFDGSHREMIGHLLGDLLCDLGYEDDDSWWRDPHDDAVAR